ADAVAVVRGVEGVVRNVALAHGLGDLSVLVDDVVRARLAALHLERVDRRAPGAFDVVNDDVVHGTGTSRLVRGVGRGHETDAGRVAVRFGGRDEPIEIAAADDVRGRGVVAGIAAARDGKKSKTSDAGASDAEKGNGSSQRNAMYMQESVPAGI